MKRRDFLKSGALGAGATVTLASCGGQEEELIPLLLPDEQILPGVDKWTASTCAICPAGCGILVRSMMGEAKVQHQGQERRQMALQVKKIEGNPKHPVNRGKLCARGQAGPQMLYNPDRIRTPLKLTGSRGSGQYQPITWEEALVLLKSKMDSIRSSHASGEIAAVAGCSSPMRQDLIQQFLEALGSKRCHREEPPGVPVLRETNRRIFGRAELEVHDLENAHYLLSFGANLLETHTSPVRYNLGLGHFRQGRPGLRGKFVQVEGRFSLTAANADEWLPVRPGTEAKAALAMAHVILKEELFAKEYVRSSVRGFENYRNWVLANYDPEKIAEEIDIPAKKLIRVAREFARHQPGLTLAGGAAIAHPNGVFVAASIQSLNVLMGNIGRQGGISWTASSARRRSSDANEGRIWTEELLSSIDSIQMLILWDADPLFTAPAGLKLKAALDRIPFIVAFSAFMDDSTAQADLILPDRTYLERWDVTEPGLTAGFRTLSITQPIVKPLYESRDCADVLLGLAKQSGVSHALSDASFREYLKRRLGDADVLKRGRFAEEDVDSFWNRFTAEGVWEDAGSEKISVSADLNYLPNTEPSPGPRPSQGEYNFYFQPFVSIALGTGKGANLPWMQELPDPMTSVVWGSWVEVNPRTAAELGLAENDLVWLESAAGKIKLPVLICAGARPDTVSVPFGQGHKLYGRYAAGRGANPWEVLAPDWVRGTGEWAWASTKVKITNTGEKARLVKLGYDREHSPAELHR